MSSTQPEAQPTYLLRNGLLLGGGLLLGYTGGFGALGLLLRSLGLGGPLHGRSGVDSLKDTRLGVAGGRTGSFTSHG